MPPPRKPPSYLEFQQGEAKKQKSRGGGPPPYVPAEFPIGIGPEAPPPTPAPAEAPPGFFENIGIGAQRAVLSASDAGRVLNEAFSAAASGDFEPLKQLAETVGRGAAPFVAAGLSGAPTAGQAFATQQAIQSGPITELTRQRQQRIEQIPELYSSQVVDEETRARLAARAGLDPSIFGKITRGRSEFVTAAIPSVVAGAVTGGSVPAVATVAGLQSLGQPENLLPTVALAATPLPLGKAVAPLLRRLRGGRGVAIEPVIDPTARPIPESPTAIPGLPIPRPVSPAPGGVPATSPGNIPAPGGPRGAIPGAENPFTALETPPGIPAAAVEQSPALRSAIEKLGTDDLNQIGAMIENANRRFRLSSTPE